ncbi:MAG TPA: pitrilysin family protein [Candidatus Eisenbacteria bacterium]|jgi:zinc protease
MSGALARSARRAAGLALLAALSPRPAAAVPVHLPAYQRTVLKNGLTVFVMPSGRLPLVDFRLVVRAGAVNDPAGKEGLAHLAAELLTQGAAARSAKQIAEDIAFVGGTLSSSSGAEQTVITCEVLRKDFDLGLELVRDCAVLPTFPAEEVDRKRDQALGEIASDRDDPSTVADHELLPFLMGQSPLAHPPIGREAAVKKLTREDVAAFQREEITPDNTILAVVGDVDPAAALAGIEAAFKPWKSSGREHRIPYQPLERSGGRAVRIVSKPEVTQTQIRMACGGVARNHPDYFPITVANTILGGGFTSRLVNEIRVVQGLTYGIGSGFRMYRNAGTFSITTFTRNETLRRCIDETVRVVKQLLEQGPTEEELAKARRYLTGQFPLGLQAPDQLADQLVEIEFYGLDPHFVENYDASVNAVTMSDCRRALKSYFCADDLKILVVSNPDTAKKALEGLGTVEVKEIE